MYLSPSGVSRVTLELTSQLDDRLLDAGLLAVSGLADRLEMSDDVADGDTVACVFNAAAIIRQSFQHVITLQ